MTDITNNQNKIEFTKEFEQLINYTVKASFQYENIPEISVSVLICDDEEIHELNRQYRDIDRPTDVLSFPMYDDEGNLDPDELGDIVISLERAKLQAEEYGHSIERELAFLTAHSMLHLFGYDHIEEDEQKEMFAKQEEILKKLGLTRGEERNV
ncbi:MAG: rRNA maturation RNase YbeY [Clostridia bacterium]|nr:rRNA maturation RNase YbeY [Clostridia bacterium]MBQ4543607.1 rRNA maturation RNase YbeY [Clostridia bacterium]